jgi:hypothetical protein
MRMKRIKVYPMNKATFISAITLTCALFNSCDEMWNHCIEGNGHHSVETRTLPAFTRIQVNGDFNVQVSIDSTSVAIVDADENLQDRIVTYVYEEKLFIETKSGDCLNSSRPIEISVVTPSVNNIELNGSGNVNCDDLFAEDFILKLSGSGGIKCKKIKADLAALNLEGSGIIDCASDVQSLTSQIEGSGEIRINGSALNSDLKVIGSGHLRAGELNTDVCKANISGSGIIDTDVNNSLDVTIIGSGIVNYFGNPVITSYISGSGKIVKQ